MLRDQKAVEGLQEMIDNFLNKDKSLPKQRAVNKVNLRKKRNGKEMRLTTQIHDFDMDQITLDLGFDTNVLPKQTLECMDKPKLQWLPI